METVKFKVEGKYVSHNVKANKSIDITFKMPYSELTNYIQSIQMLNENVEIGAKVGAEKPKKLGTFMISNINIDNDGEGKIKLNSQLDFIDSAAINDMASKADEPLIILFKATIYVEEAEDEAV